MAICTSPRDAWTHHELKENGKKLLVHRMPQQIWNYSLTPIPCGKCLDCRLDHSRQWAVRSMHESSIWESNCFITLTYDPEFLPLVPGTNVGTLVKKDPRDFERFMKRLRKHCEGEKDVIYKGQRINPIRFYHCGEYGDKNGRPHYHASIFNYNFPDQFQIGESKTGHPLYTSEKLLELWPFGIATVQTFTFETAGYVSRYCTKKINGDMAESHYSVADLFTGEILGRRLPEYATMSRRPGIAAMWFDKYKSEVYPDDFVVMLSKNGKGFPLKPPSYYDSLFEIDSPELFKEMKAARAVKAKKFDKRTPKQLDDHAVIVKQRYSKLIRSL